MVSLLEAQNEQLKELTAALTPSEAATPSRTRKRTRTAPISLRAQSVPRISSSAGDLYREGLLEISEEEEEEVLPSAKRTRHRRGVSEEVIVEEAAVRESVARGGEHVVGAEEAGGEEYVDAE